LQEGSGRTQTIRMILVVTNTEAITLKIDPSVVLATRKYVDDEVLELRLYVDDQMRNHIAAQDPHTQYAQKHNPTFTGEPKAPTPAAGNNTTRIATTEFVQAAITALINGAPATLDTLKEIAAAINNDPKFSTTINNALSGKQPLDETLTHLSGKDVAGLLAYLGLRASGQYTDNLLFTGPDGLKIQVFRRTLANLTTVGVVNSVPVTFPVPFPVNCWGVFSTKLTWVQITNSCEWVSNTGFTAQVMMNIAVNTNTSDAMFLAIGY
ncbi:phage tail protein, partial [Escherichia coli]|nr:phage tail protein [Escherichia coli]